MFISRYQKKVVFVGFPNSPVYKNYVNVISGICENICKWNCTQPNLQAKDNAGKSDSRKGSYLSPYTKMN